MDYTDTGNNGVHHSVSETKQTENTRGPNGGNNVLLVLCLSYPVQLFIIIIIVITILLIPVVLCPRQLYLHFHFLLRLL